MILSFKQYILEKEIFESGEYKVNSKILDKFIKLAKKKSGKIFPPSKCKTFDKCVRKWKDELWFYYDDSFGSTKIVTLKA